MRTGLNSPLRKVYKDSEITDLEEMGPVGPVCDLHQLEPGGSVCGLTCRSPSVDQEICSTAVHHYFSLALTGWVKYS